jgi:cell volume regulation protein A
MVHLVGWASRAVPIVLARKLGVAMPDPADEQLVRAIFRDFPLEPTTTIGSVCEFYGLPRPTDASAPLGDLVIAELRLAPVAGDIVQLGAVALVVREVECGKIWRIGLGLGG